MEGDNVKSAKLLLDIADRVCLGLLPSSTKGWILAVNVMKKIGGILHVHENVLDNDLKNWTQETCLEFENLFFVAGKPMKVSCIHTEKVKSYAPHVLHIVVDLFCQPI